MDLKHYAYDTGREGDSPQLAFSPRKASITIYFGEGFERYAKELSLLGKHEVSVSCLYIRKLEDVDVAILRDMLAQSYGLEAKPAPKPVSVEEYIARIPAAARQQFGQLRCRG